jgi:hypothetical protein
MFPSYGFPSLYTRIHPQLRAHSTKVIGVSIGVVLVAGMIVLLPDGSTSAPSTATTSAAVPTSVAAPAPEESLTSFEVACEKQAWPYIDQRCAESAAKAASQATRQVRVVSTDRGTSSTIVTAIAPAPAKPPADISQLRDSVAKLEPPAKEPATATPPSSQAGAQVSDQNYMAMAVSFQDSPAQTAAPEQAAPIANNPETEDAAPRSKAKAKAAEKRAAKQLKARRQTVPVPATAYAQDTTAAPEQTRPEQTRTSRVPTDVVQAVEAATAEDRTQSRVPADVVRAVESDIRRSRTSPGYGSELVTVSSPRSRGQRVFLVPRERESVEVSDR